MNKDVREGYYTGESELRIWILSETSQVFNRIMNKTGNWYNDVPPTDGLLRKVNNPDGGYTLVPYRFIIGPIHESEITFI